MTTTECGVCGGVADWVGEFRTAGWGESSAMVLHEFYRCRECATELYEPGQMQAVTDRVVLALSNR